MLFCILLQHSWKVEIISTKNYTKIYNARTENKAYLFYTYLKHNSFLMLFFLL